MISHPSEVSALGELGNPKLYIACCGVLGIHVLGKSLPLFLFVKLRVVLQSVFYGAAEDGVRIKVAVGLCTILP